MRNKYFLILLICLITQPSWAVTIYPVSAAVGVTHAYITWTTDSASDSRVDYGTTTAYGSNVTGGSSVTHHELNVSGLTANTTYHYKVTSNGTASGDYNFTTYANPSGVVRTVGSGKTYATIQACATAATAGDTCLIYAGTYNEESIAPANSGSSGSYITFLAQEPAGTYSFNIANKTYIAIKGMELTSTTTHAVHAYGAHNALIENNYLHPAGYQLMAYHTLDGNEANNSIIRKNIVWMASNDAQGIYAYGDNVLVENNDISGGSDSIEWGAGGGNGTGINSVIRNNVIHHHSHADIGGGEHIDGIQLIGGTYGSYTLIEGNTVWSCIDSTHNCHGIFQRSSPAGGSGIGNNFNIIVRHNYIYGMDGAGIAFGAASDDNVLYGHAYNNTLALLTNSSDAGLGLSWYNSTGTGGVGLNNLFYAITEFNASPTVFSPSGPVTNYNVAYDPGDPAFSWGTPYASEATYNTLKNLNPTFTNYPYSAAIASNSPLIDIGGPLTTVTSGCNSTTLVLGDSRFFQSGWAGTNADQLAIGTVGNTATISSITYATNTVVFTSSVSCTNGANVWLAKNSSGTQVLYGSAPDIGAYEYNGGGDVTAPTVTITTSNQTITSDSLTVTGTASDDTAVTGVKYRIGFEPDATHGTSCTGTTSWSCSTSGYSSGANSLYVGCTDAAGNWPSPAPHITVTYNPSATTSTLGPGTMLIGGSVR